MNTLDQLIEEGYKIFAKYRVSALSVRDFWWCLCENSSENLLQVAVKDLDTVTITDYIDALHLDDDDDYFREEMRALLPRILELLVSGTKLSLSVKRQRALLLNGAKVWAILPLDALQCNHSMWLEHEIDFLQRFATAYIENGLSKSLKTVIESVVMFDRAKLSTTYLLEIFFNIILNNRHDINMIQQITDLVYHCHNHPINYLASPELDTQFKKIFHSHNFKNAFITTIFHNIEKENLTQDEINTYEIAFEVLSGI